jgi:hypothetical protein
MATQLDPRELDLQEQLARIRQIGMNTDKIILENQKLQLERLKVEADTEKAIAEVRKLNADTKVVSFAAVFQGFIAIAAMLGAGAAIIKLFFP